MEAQNRGEGAIASAIAPEEEVFDEMSPEEVFERDEDRERVTDAKEEEEERRFPARSVSLTPVRNLFGQVVDREKDPYDRPAENIRVPARTVSLSPTIAPAYQAGQGRVVSMVRD